MRGYEAPGRAADSDSSGGGSSSSLVLSLARCFCNLGKKLALQEEKGKTVVQTKGPWMPEQQNRKAQAHCCSPETSVQTVPMSVSSMT